jgi:aspartyl-tRNA(Asn)/glutamyl-tRNA(Gln) amidotransferase subunit C
MLPANRFAKAQVRGWFAGQRIGFVAARLQAPEPVLDEAQDTWNVEQLVQPRVTLQVRARQFEQRRRRTQTRPRHGVLLHVHKGAGELDQALEEIRIGPLPIFEPELLEHVVRFVEQPAVEALEVTKVMRVQIAAPAGLDQSGNLCAFVAHALRMGQARGKRKAEAGRKAESGKRQKAVREGWNRGLRAAGFLAYSPGMAATEFDVHYVADLARLELTPEEERKFGSQLGQVLGYIEKLRQLDVSQVEPTAHAMPLVNVMRPDQTSPSLSNEEALRNAPAKANGLFLVPKIVE